jgi:hypothetical protein
MKTTVTKYDFRQAFSQFSENYANQFNPAGLDALHAYIEDLEADTGVETELDVIATCCEWNQYDSAMDAIESLRNNCEEVMGSVEIADDENPDLLEISKREEIEARKWLEDRAVVIDADDGSILVSNF